jgi:hypothetical protein
MPFIERLRSITHGALVGACPSALRDEAPTVILSSGALFWAWAVTVRIRKNSWIARQVKEGCILIDKKESKVRKIHTISLSIASGNLENIPNTEQAWSQDGPDARVYGAAIGRLSP